MFVNNTKQGFAEHAIAVRVSEVLRWLFKFKIRKISFIISIFCLLAICAITK